MPVITEKPPEPITALPGENPASNPRAGIGHNEPPLEERIAMEFREALLTDKPDFLQRVEDSIAAVDRAHVEDDETLKRAGDLDKILRACEQRVTDTHKVVKQPYLDGGRAVDAEKNRFAGRITDARKTLGSMMSAFMAKREAAERAERQRIADEQRAAEERARQAEREREEAERAAREAAANATSEDEREAAAKRAAEAREVAEAAMAEAALAPAAPVGRAEPVRSDAGATISGRTVWNSEVEDYSKAFRAVKGDAKVREAIDAAIARRVKAGDREIAGTRIWSTIQAVAR